eukprot:1159748-Alexandrium_andersonii.AAC.1
MGEVDNCGDCGCGKGLCSIQSREASAPQSRWQVAQREARADCYDLVRQVFDAVSDDALTWLEPTLLYWRGKDGKARAER